MHVILLGSAPARRVGDGVGIRLREAQALVRIIRWRRGWKEEGKEQKFEWGRHWGDYTAAARLAVARHPPSGGG